MLLLSQWSQQRGGVRISSSSSTHRGCIHAAHRHKPRSQHLQQPCDGGAAPHKVAQLLHPGVQARRARPLVLVCAASNNKSSSSSKNISSGGGYERLQDQVTVLQAPDGSAAGYLVGISLPNAGAAGMDEILGLLAQLQQQGQQDILLLLDPAAAAAAVPLVQPDAGSMPESVQSQQQQQQQQQQAPSADLLSMCEHLAAAFGLQLQVWQPSMQQGAVASLSSSSSSSIGSSDDRRSSSSSSLGGLLASGLGFARRAATAAVAAVGAAAAAAAAGQSEQVDESDVDVLFDLPDFDLRMRHGDWDPERAALSWHAAVLFVTMLKQLQDQGWEVELRDGVDEMTPELEQIVAEVLEEAKQMEAIRLLKEVRALFSMATGGQDPLADDEEEAQQWLAVLMSAQEPQLVVSELEAMLEEWTADQQRLLQAGLDPPFGSLLPTAQDMVRRLDAQYGEAAAGSDSDSDSDGDSDSDSDAETGAGGGEQQEDPADSPSSASSSSGSSAAEAAADAAEGANAADSSSSGRIEASDSDSSSSSSSGRGSAADAAGQPSSSGLDASDAVINARSSQELIQAMMRLERSWTRAEDSTGNSSSGSTGNAASTGTTDSSSKARGSRSSSPDKPIPELLPRPILPQQPKGAATGGSSSSSSSSSPSTDPSEGSSSGRAQGTAAGPQDVGPSAPPGSRVRRINRQAGPSGAAAAGGGDSDAAAADSSSGSAPESGSSEDAAAAEGHSQPSSGRAAAAEGVSSSAATNQPQASEQSQGQPLLEPGMQPEQQQQQQQEQSQAESAAAAQSGSMLEEAGVVDAAAAAVAAADLEAELQRIIDERAEAVAQGQPGSDAATVAAAAAAAGAAAAKAAGTAAAEAADAADADAAATAGGGGSDDDEQDSGVGQLGMGLEEAGWEGDVAEFEAHVRSEFARFEAYLLSRGVSLSREARIEAFVEIFEVQTVDDNDEQEGEEEEDGEGEDGEGDEEGEQDWGASEFRGLIAGMLLADGDANSKGGGGRRGVTNGRGMSSDGRQQGAAAAGEGVVEEEPASPGQDAADKTGSRAGGQKGELPAYRSSSSSSSGIGSGPGWEQFRSSFGQEGVDKLQELLRAESLLMSGMEFLDMITLADALNRMKQGERLSTVQLRIMSRLLEAEPNSGNSGDSGNSSAGGSGSDPKGGDKGRKRQQRSGASRRGGSTARTPGSNVSAKDVPLEQDLRVLRLPKPYRRRRREQVQLLLKQLRLQQQQHRLVRQQRATQLQLWRLLELLQGQQQPQAQAEGGPGQQASLSQPADSLASSSSSSSRRSRLADAFKAAWRRSMHDQEAGQQQAETVVSAQDSGESAADASAAAGRVRQLRGLLAAAAPVVVAVVPLQQLGLIERAWEQQQSGDK